MLDILMTTIFLGIGLTSAGLWGYFWAKGKERKAMAHYEVNGIGIEVARNYQCLKEWLVLPIFIGLVLIIASVSAVCIVYFAVS